MQDIDISKFVKPAMFNGNKFSLLKNNQIKTTNIINSLFFLKAENILLAGESSISLNRNFPIFSFDLTNGKLISKQFIYIYY